MTTKERIELEKAIRKTLYSREYKYHAYMVCCEHNKLTAAKRYYKEFEAAVAKHFALYHFALSVCPIFKKTYTVDHIVYDWLGIFPLEVKKSASSQAEADFKNGFFTSKYDD